MPPRRRQSVPSHTEALAGALAALDLETVDDAAKRLALGYASMIDADATALQRIGSHYLAVLAALGLTPAARASLAKGGTDGGTPGLDDLARLRAERSASR